MAVDSTRTAAVETPGVGEAHAAAVGAAGRRRRQAGNLYLVLALMASDFLATLSAIGLSYVLRFHSGWFAFEYLHSLQGYAGLITLQLCFLPIILAANRLYRPVRAVSWFDQASAVFTSVSECMALVVLVGGFIWPDAVTSRLMILFVWVLTMGIVFLGRVVVLSVVAMLRARGLGVSRVIVVGSGEAAGLVLDRMRRAPGLGYQPVGLVVETLAEETAHGLPVLGSVHDIGALVRQLNIDDVFIASETLTSQQVLTIVSICGTEQVNIRVFPDLYQIMTTGVSTSELNGLPLVTVKDVALKGFNLALKRGLDLTVSAIGLVLLSPLLLLIAILIKITSPDGPVFLLQERVGLDGKPFLMIKFRTMRPDAEALTGPMWAVPDDPRRTWIGGWLRRFSLDELPQLINVLLGEMSLVGPRPERPVFVERFSQSIPRYLERHNEKAGITGWAQVNGLRGNTSIEERTAYDLWYVENWTLWLDIKILLKTLLIVFRDKNAY